MVVKSTTTDLPAEWRSPSRRLMRMRRYEILAVGVVAAAIVAVAAVAAGQRHRGRDRAGRGGRSCRRSRALRAAALHGMGLCRA